MGRLVERAGYTDAPVGSLIPLSANIQENRPEIGGSFGGFIAVVVALAVIFIAACTAIFILLRDHEPTRYERQRRRARARQRSEFTNEVPLGPPGMRERFARLFGRRSGWIKASGEEGDEWDASEDPAPLRSTSELAVQQRERGAHEYPASMASGPLPLSRSDSVEVELRAPSGRTPTSSLFLSQTPSRGSDGDGGSVHGRGLAAGEGTDRAQVSSPMPSRESPPSTLEPTVQEDVDAEYKPRDDRHFSIQTTSSGTGSISIRSMRKFDNGTKFKEGLIF